MQKYKIPDLNRVRELTKENIKEWPGGHDHQDSDAFNLIPKAAKDSVYTSFELDDINTPHRFTIFAGFAHKFAENLLQARTESGEPAFDLLSSDPCEYWADVGRKKGLEVLTVGAEDLPESEGTIAHISYEPYPIYDKMTDMVAVIRALAQTEKGYGEFESPPSCYNEPVEFTMRMELQCTPIIDYNKPAERKKSDMLLQPRFQIAKKLYGAELAKTYSPWLESDLIISGKDSKARAKRDIKIIEYFTNSDEASLDELADSINESKRNIKFALQRLDRLSRMYYPDEASWREREEDVEYWRDMAPSHMLKRSIKEIKIIGRM